MTEHRSGRNPRHEQYARLHCFVTKILFARMTRKGDSALHDAGAESVHTLSMGHLVQWAIWPQISGDDDPSAACPNGVRPDRAR
jgi:hypothetical protein